MSFKLVEFSVENFKIFKEKATFSMVGRKDESHTFLIGNESLMRSAMIYGPNASGKSTLLEALRLCDRMIRKSLEESADGELPYNPYLFSNQESNPTRFEIIFSIKKDFYNYSFSYNEKEILVEELLIYRTNIKTLFRRESNKKLVNDKKSFQVASDLEGTTRENVLILTRAAATNTKLAVEILESFKKGINVIVSKFGGLGFSNITANQIASDTNNKNKILEFLQKADFCISDLNVREEEMDDEFRKKYNIPKSHKDYSIDLFHNVFDDTGSVVTKKSLDLSEESLGTEAYFGILGPVVDTLEGGKVLCVDEFDRSLHPLLTKFIVDLFENPETNPKNAQLIVTTHDTSLLNYKNDFTKYHFWFTDKDKYGAGKLYSLAEFKSNRNEEKFEEKYLGGRFGAIPLIK